MQNHSPLTVADNDISMTSPIEDLYESDHEHNDNLA